MARTLILTGLVFVALGVLRHASPMHRLAPFLLAALLYAPHAALAGAADVVAAEAKCSSRKGTCDFEVTVRHADEGWKHYANRWEVLGPGGEVLATRALLHPHVGEQPFTRSLRGVVVPASITRVRIRAHDSVHGTGGAEVEVEVER